MKNVLIFGGTGFLGRSLADHLAERGMHITLIGRTAPLSCPHIFVKWDAKHLGDWMDHLAEADVVINLAGRSVNCIKTVAHKAEIIDSRVETTQLIGSALRQMDHRVALWLQMSTAHIYGDSEQELFTESSSTGCGFAPDVGRAWESAFDASLPAGIRGVILRTSFVIGKDGGALPQMALLVKLGLGGRVGSGKQGISWIHLHDFNRLMHEMILDVSFDGIYIVSAPQPVSQREFMRALRSAMGVRLGLPAAAWMASMGAKYLFRTDPELVLLGRYVVSERLQSAGFHFMYRSIDEALRNIFSHR